MLKPLLSNSSTSITFAALTLVAASTGPAIGGELVPYHGSARGRVMSRENINGGLAVPFGQPFCHVTAEAAGNFTHVGQSTIRISYDMALIIENGIPYLIGEGSYLLTAASGATLSGPIYTLQNFLTGEFTAESAIINGTGRFHGATGTMEGFGRLSIDTDTFEYVLEGEMTTVSLQKQKQ